MVGGRFCGESVVLTGMSILQGPVDDLECTEMSPEHANTRRPSHPSNLNFFFLVF